MYKLSAAILGSVLLSLGIAHSGEIADQFEASPKDESSMSGRDFDEIRKDNTGITEIGLERTPCYGTCPSYTVLIKADGTFRYKGEQHVERKGEFTGRVSPWELNNLLNFIKETDYPSLQSACSVPVTDNPTVYTYVVMNGKKKIIDNYANSGPSKLWAIEQLIDKLLLTADWNKK